MRDGRRSSVAAQHLVSRRKLGLPGAHLLWDAMVGRV
jgi:hypothetical protein